MILTGKHIRLKKSLHTVVDTDPIIIKMEVEEHEFLDLKDIEEVRKANLELSGGKPFCVLLDTRKGYFNVSPEASKLLAGEKFAKKRTAAAFIAKSLPTKIASNFFLRFNRPITPTRVFSNEKDALAWLKTFANKIPG